MTVPEDIRPEPAVEFGEVWDLLDALPRANASEALAATTVDMVAVHLRGRRAAGPVRRLGPLAAVAAALVAGIVAGRVTAPDPDRQILERLPLVKHLDLLREAGSTKFLEAMHQRRYPLPMRLMIRQGPGAREDERRQFEAEVAALGAELAAGSPAGRRESVQALSVEERLELEKAAEQFMRLSATERRAVEAVAEALVDPARQDLRDAAAMWRQWLLSARPEDRAGIVARGTDKRLEWLEWYAVQAARPEGRPDLRGLDRPPRGPRRDERPPFRPDAPPRPAPPAGPAETPAPPR